METNQHRIWIDTDGFAPVDDYLSGMGIKSIFLVHGRSMYSLPIGLYFKDLPSRLGIRVEHFSEFQPNPDITSVAKGIRLFQEHPCDAIVAVGGGSAMDVAKGIKLFCAHELQANWFKQAPAPHAVPLMVSPTTAGTGSEATRFAVLYAEGEKQSIQHDDCLPLAVVFDARSLVELPPYQRKSAMLDALCHGIESYWSINSTAESRELSREALQGIMTYKDRHLANEPEGNAGMMRAACRAGQAINITQTTAGHAMCYKLTSLYGVSHGHAAALCVSVLWPYMLNHLEDCVDKRGASYLYETMKAMVRAMGGSSAEEGTELLRGFLDAWGMKSPRNLKREDIEKLAGAVHQKRLKNHPIRLDEAALRKLYFALLER